MQGGMVERARSRLRVPDPGWNSTPLRLVTETVSGQARKCGGQPITYELVVVPVLEDYSEAKC